MLWTPTDTCAENRLPDLDVRSSMFEMYAQNGFIGFMYMLGMFCWIFETVLSGYVCALSKIVQSCPSLHIQEREQTKSQVGFRTNA